MQQWNIVEAQSNKLFLSQLVIWSSRTQKIYFEEMKIYIHGVLIQISSKNLKIYSWGVNINF